MCIKRLGGATRAPSESHFFSAPGREKIPAESISCFRDGEEYFFRVRFRPPSPCAHSQARKGKSRLGRSVFCEALRRLPHARGKKHDTIKEGDGMAQTNLS